jgi:hypothetical protein
MRYIDMSIHRELKDGPLVLTSTIVQHHIEKDARFNANGRGIRASTRIDQAVRAWMKHWVKDGNVDLVALKEWLMCPAGSCPRYLALEGEDWKILSEAIEDPQPMGGENAYVLRPPSANAEFIDAITKAPESEPAALRAAAE